MTSFGKLVFLLSPLALRDPEVVLRVQDDDVSVQGDCQHVPD